MADNDEQDWTEAVDDEILDGSPDSESTSFGEVPVVRDDLVEPDDGRSVVEAKAAADAEAAGLQHWTAPPTGQVPAILSDRARGSAVSGVMEGPSWHDEDSTWTGPGLAEVLGEGLVRPELDDEDDEEEVAAYRSSSPLSRPHSGPGENSGPGEDSSSDEQPAATGIATGTGPEPFLRSAALPARRNGPDGEPPNIDDIRFVAPSERRAREASPATSARPDGGSAGSPGGPVDRANPAPGRAPGPSPDRGPAAPPPRRSEPRPATEHDSGLDGSSDLGRRVAVGVALVVILAGALFLGPAMTLLLVVVLAGAAVLELYNSMRLAGLRPAILLGLVGAVATPAVAFSRGDAAFPLIVALTVVFGALWYLVGADTERPVLNLSLTMMGVFWIGGLAGFAALILRLDGGTELLLATIIITAASDIMAYVGGRAYGAKPFHRASPNKTWEGTITGFLGALFAGFAIGVTEMGTIWDGQSLVTALALGAVVGVLAPAGDLAESVVKRDLGVKDMGRLLPGHGGVLDRVDALLFALPGAYYLALISGLLDASTLIP